MGFRYIYVIGVSRNPVKIGIADRVQHRLASLQIGCPDLLTVYHAVQAPKALAQPIEAVCHRELADHHRHGEWFNIDADDALATINRLSADIRAKAEAEARAKGDLVDQLAATWKMSEWSRDALTYYRSQASVSDSQIRVLKINAYIRREAGNVAFNTFWSVVMEKRSAILALMREESAYRTSTEKNLARAINALADYYARGRADWLYDKVA